MKHLKSYKIWESVSKAGEYTTEEMDLFVNEISELIPWNSEETESYLKVRVSIPSDRNSHTSCETKEKLLNSWKEALRKYGSDENLVWYVWNCIFEKSQNQPAKFSSQRYDIESILELLKTQPDTFKYLSISFDSEGQRKFSDYMSKEWYGSGQRYTGD